MATARDDLQEVTGRAPRRRGPPAGQRGQAAADLEQLGKQAGLFGLGFAPGAGMADYFGQFPSAQGGTEPSAVENFQQGNYGTAAMQGLGAMGDLALTVPVAGAAIGSVMKAPRAAQRMLNAMPKVDDLGFYSQAEKALMDIPQQKGTGQQYLAQIQKTPGVRQEELQYTGLDEFLASKPTVTKAEIQDYIDTNRVQVQDVTLGSPSKGQITSQTSNDIREILEAGQVFDDDAASFLERYQRANLSGRRDMQTEASLEEYLRSAGDNRTIDEVAEASRGIAGNTTKFSSYTLPGGENYREVLLTLPEKTPANFPDFDSYFNERYLNSSNGYTTPEAIAYARQDAMRNWKNSGEQIPMSDASAGNYTSSHFDQSNILAHMRLNDRVIDGKPTLFVEEIQSDWHQAGRSRGYKTGNERAPAQVERELMATTQKRSRLINEAAALPDSEMTKFIAMNEEIKALDAQATKLDAEWSSLLNKQKGVPDAPFKTTWDDLALKRAIKMASDEGYEQIAFTTGKTQAARYDLSKQIQKIIYGQPNKNGLRRVEAITPTGDKLLGKKYSISEIEDNVGKEVAEKITKSVGVFDERTGTYSMGGVDLEIGGEGMKGFYDKMLPKKLEKMGKKYGVKPTKSNMDTPKGPVEVWTMDIPDEMSEVISSQGQPLFQIGAGAGLGAAGIMGLTAGEAEAASD